MRTHTLIVSLSLVGCGSIGGPSLDDLNRTYAIPDPGVDDTPPEASFEPAQRRDVGDADAVFEAPRHNQFVHGVAMPGDLDADGFGDLIVWSYEHADPDVVDCSEGCPSFARLVLHIDYGGPDFAADGRVEADASIEGWYVNGALTWVAPAGDLDGDGVDDVLISVGGEGCQQGNVFELHGGARLSGRVDVRDLGETLREREACTQFGNAAGVGDLDGDGLGDFVVAAPTEGVSFLFYGRPGGPDARRTEDDADAVLRTAEASGIGAGQPAGDVDGDGLDDLLIAPAPSAFADERPGTWFLLRGGARRAGDVLVEDGATRILDAALVQTLGDLDGDGRAELGVTRQRAGVDGFVLVGREAWPASVGVEDGVLRIERTSEGGATSLRPAGDVDGDGALDLVYTDSRESSDEFPRGAVHLFRGPLSMSQGTLTRGEGTAFLGQYFRSEHDDVVRGHDVLGEWSWRIGMGFAAGSDLDGDGYDEMAILGRIAPDHGRVYLWRGRP